jgi:hypothetical protein
MPLGHIAAGRNSGTFMALPKHGSRLIVVDGKAYRWAIAGKRSLPHSDLRIVVEAANNPGQRLIRWADFGELVKPRDVRWAIIEALWAGWTPHQLGPELRRGLTPDKQLEAIRNFYRQPGQCDPV